MNLIPLAVVVIAIAVVVQVMVMVPTVLQLRKTLAAGENFLKGMKALIEDEVKPAVRSLNATLQEMEGVAKGAREGVEKIDDALEAVREVGNTVRSINSVLDKAVRPPIINVAAWLTGVKVGIGALVEALMHSKSKEVQ
jgi:uncharacterized protein YoxC